jgi:arylamine N-acetyltransferase
MGISASLTPWGLDKDAAVRACLWFRDIPYAIEPSRQDFGYHCFVKMKYMNDILQQLGYTCRLRMGRFDWREQPLPPEVLQYYIHSPLIMHAFLEFSVNGGETWKILDPTFDVMLKNTGLPVVEWDGLAETPLAMVGMEIVSPEDGARYVADCEANHLWESVLREQNANFFFAMDKWMNAERRKFKTSMFQKEALGETTTSLGA